MCLIIFDNMTWHSALVYQSLYQQIIFEPIIEKKMMGTIRRNGLVKVLIGTRIFSQISRKILNKIIKIKRIKYRFLFATLKLILIHKMETPCIISNIFGCTSYHDWQHYINIVWRISSLCLNMGLLRTNGTFCLVTITTEYSRRILKNANCSNYLPTLLRKWFTNKNTPFLFFVDEDCGWGL